MNVPSANQVEDLLSTLSPKLEIRLVSIQNLSSQGANLRVLATDFRPVYIIFSLTLMVDFSFPIKVFKNQRDEKNLKKIDSYVWYIKRTALKNLD